MQRLQKSQLLDNEEQEEEPGPAGAEKVLSGLQAPHGAQGSKVTSDKWQVTSPSSAHACHSSLITRHCF
jgi:hypothetical protein